MIARIIANKLLPQSAWEATYTCLSGSYACNASCLRTAAQPPATATASCSSQLHLFTTANSSEQLSQTPRNGCQFSSRNIWTSTTAFSAGDPQGKRHAMKCNTAAGTPVSMAVACMVDRDVMPRQQLCAKMDQLSQQLAQDVAACSSTELSAFAEACRKMEYQNTQAFKAIIQQLAPHASSIAADELPSLLWAASTLASKTPGGRAAGSSSSSGGGGGSSVTCASTSIGSLFHNDGVIGSVNSSRIADMPEVVDFMLGASEVLTGDLVELECLELPIIAAALADLEYRDPFLLTVLAEGVLEARHELNEQELLELLQSFASMGRWFFDNRVLDQLTHELLDRAQQGLVAQEVLLRVAECLAGINHKNKALAAHLQKA